MTDTSNFDDAFAAAFAGDEAPDAPEAPPEAPDAAEAPPDAAGEADLTSGDPLILGKFRSQDDLQKAYQELERKLGQASAPQPVQEAPQQPVYDPAWGEPQTEEELVAWAERDPSQAGWWAVQNSSRLPEQLYENVMRLWSHTDNHSYSQTMLALHMQGLEQRMMQQFQQNLTPALHHTYTTMANSASELARQEIGQAEYDSYKERVGALLQPGGSDPLGQALQARINAASNPNQIKDVLVDAYLQLRARDWWARRGDQAPVAETVEPDAPRAVTQQRGRAQAAPTGDAAYAAAFQDAILNAKA